MFHDDEHVEEAKGRRDHDTEITRHDRLGMVPYKGLPALRRHAFPSFRVQALRQIFAYGAWRYAYAQLEHQFMGDALLTPRGVFPRHTADEGLQIRRDRWASRSGLPAPEDLESLPMPAEKRLRLHNG